MAYLEGSRADENSPLGPFQDWRSFNAFLAISKISVRLSRPTAINSDFDRSISSLGIKCSTIDFHSSGGIHNVMGSLISVLIVCCPSASVSISFSPMRTKAVPFDVTVGTIIDP